LDRQRLEAGQLDLCEAQFEFFWTARRGLGEGAAGLSDSGQLLAGVRRCSPDAANKGEL
jgi:hypothetical protein